MIPIPSRRKKLASEPDFERPPLWIHEVVAGILGPGDERKTVSSAKREARRRALLEMLDRIPIARDGRTVKRRRPAPAVQEAAVRPPSGPSSPARR